MRILLSNDDGYQAPGILCLATVLSEMAEVITVAPDRDRSGASNSLTLDRPLRVTAIQKNVYCVNGTPTDSVHLAITGLLDFKPDMVISGINRGYNLGDDVLDSGTVAAAIEGRYLGFPAIAVSLGRPAYQYETAARIVKDLVQRMLKKPLPRDTILNVNVPYLPLDKIVGIDITRFGKRHASSPMIPAHDPRGFESYWVGLPGSAQDAGVGTDFHAINQSRVSVTPFRLDWTDYDKFEHLNIWLNK